MEWLAIVPGMISLALKLIVIFTDNKNADNETKQALAKLSSFLQQNGVKVAKIRHEAEDQIAEGDQMWKDKESPTQPTGEKKT